MILPHHHFALLLFSLTSALATQAAEPLRPPSVPLVAHDPYLSIWSPADKLTDADTVHWTGKPNRLTSLVRVDGKTFRLMGSEPATMPALPQTRLEVTPTRTLYTFDGAGIQLTLTFMTPALPDDLDVLSRPLTYLTFEARATDNNPHDVAIYQDVAAELAVNEPTQQVACSQGDTTGLAVLKCGSHEQPVLAKSGDNLRIDWGTLYLAAPRSPKNSAHILPPSVARATFAAGGEFPLVKMTMPLAAKDAPVAAIVLDFTQVGAEPVSRWLMLAYDDEFSIKYFEQNLRPYWRRNGDDAAALLKKAAADYPALTTRCSQFDQQLVADLSTTGDKYAQLATLAYRQTLAGNKICADAKGQPLMFPKENFSNGCIGTVDVLFPQLPFFLTLSPALTKAMLIPVLDYAASPRWPYGYAPHDLGTYPHATGQVYGMDGGDGNRMPVEECGNMLIMLAALANQQDNADLANAYWPMLTKWADYLVKEGLDPQNQLCSADMFGHLPRNANLALKAIIGIGGFAQLCTHAGKPAAATKYLAIARDYATKWQALAKDDHHTRLAYDQPGSWSMKHNLIWDSVLGLNLFPAAIADAEIAWYLKVQKKYGLPVDHRTDTSLIDWALWSIAPARNAADFQELLEPIWRYANETPSRAPLADWYVTTHAKKKGFQARPVVGGIFIKMLTDKPTWSKWAKLGADTHGPWAPLPVANSLPGLRKLFDSPLRDTSICVGPDHAYYLTGTTGHPTWWTTNEGIHVWRSTDLTNWQALGLVWSLEKDATWQKAYHGGRRAIWAPEIHYLKGTFWLAYCVNWPNGGTGLLKSSSGKAEGPYVDVKPDGPLTSEIDASLFQDDDGQVYFVYLDGKIARLKDDLSGLAEDPRLLKPANFSHVGFEGAFITKANGRYQLVCAEFNPRDGNKAYDCMVASSDNIYGPYGDRYLALPHAGHNMFFKDPQGQWWSTFFGSDPKAPWTERPGILPITFGTDGRVRPSAGAKP
ncbi:MAG: DUF4965 domain-containing protein [Verrucomicrobiota bacterium]